MFWRDLNFCLEFLVMLKDSFILKIRLISKFVASQPGEQLIAIHILTIISRSKDNHAMKFGLLIRENRKIFFLKNQTKYSGYTIHIFFLKFQNRASLDQNSEVLCSLLLMYVKNYWNRLKLSCRPFVITSCKAFLKNKKVELVFLPNMCIFLPHFPGLIYYQFSFSGCLYLLREILDNMYIVIVC